MNLKVQGNKLFPLSHSDTIQIDKNISKLNITRGSFCYRGSILWNDMPIDLRKEETYKKFKIKLKKWVKEAISHKP